MPPAVTPLLDSAQVEAEIRRRLAHREPTLDALARRHLARLTPDHWTIEWHLPLWLGRRFDLDPRLVAALVRGNVLGLLSIRLDDDLEDGEVPATEVPSTRALAHLAFESAVTEYRVWFDERSPIWAHVERSMADWRAGAAGVVLPARGAPLNIAGFACCLAGDRLDLWPTLNRSLDGAVTALVLYDQFCDWEVDLAAGRWNAFVGAIADGAQEDARRDRARSAVLAAMMTRNVVRDHFDAALSEASQAATLAAGLGITELAEFLTAWAARTSAQGASIAEYYDTAADRATRLLFGTRMGGAAA